MNTDHHHLHPPTTTTTNVDFHHQPPSSTTAAVDSTSTTESRLAAALGRAFLNIPPSSFHNAAVATPTTTTATATATNPLIRTLSDADSSANQTTTATTTTPPKIPRNHPIRRSLSDTITGDYEQTPKTATKNPLRRTLSDTSDFQQPLKTPRVSSSPQSSTGKQSPQSEIILKKVEDMVREIEQRCWEIMRQEEHVAEEVHHPEPQDQEECVGVERLKNGDLRFELSCSCGKRFEMLIKHNGYCFYRLT